MGTTARVFILIFIFASRLGSRFRYFSACLFCLLGIFGNNILDKIDTSD